MEAIITTYRGPTNTRGSRLTVKAGDSPRKTVGWDHALDSEENHRRAAEAFLAGVATSSHVRGLRLVAGAPIKPGQWAWIAEIEA
jgi:hypothetical protein